MALWADGATFLAQTCAAKDPEVIFRTSRSSTLHLLLALKVCCTCLGGATGKSRSSLAKSFEDLVRSRSSLSLPDAAMAKIIELDEVDKIFHSAGLSQAEPFPGATAGNQIQFPRTTWKKFNREPIGWVPEYSLCVYAMANSFLSLLIWDTLGFDQAMFEVSFGHHFHSEDLAHADLDNARVEQFREASRQFLAHRHLLDVMQGPRWKIPLEELQASFLDGPIPPPSAPPDNPSA